VELRGFEPLTSSMPLRRAPSCATAPRLLSALTADNGCRPAATSAAIISGSPLRLPGEFGLVARPDAPCRAPTVSDARLSAGSGLLLLFFALGI
jgi:hypothetical protein